MRVPGAVRSSWGRVVPFVAAVALGVAVQGWAALQWPANFDSDEAIFGLMARHILYRGEFPLYCYGQAYMGSLDSLLASLSMRLWGPTVLALRVPQLFLFALWMALHALWVTRWYGRRVALLSLLILDLPGWRMLYWTYRVNISPNLVLGLGSAILLLTIAPRRSQGTPLRAALVGALTGLLLWVNPLGITFPFTIACMLWLRSPQWAAARADLKNRGGRLSLALLLAGLPLAAALLGILTFFSSACEPHSLFAALRTIAAGALAAIGLAIILTLWRNASRFGYVARNAGAFALGFLIGSLPQWLSWLARGIRPSPALLPSCPSGIPGRARLVFGTLLPGLWGLPPLERLPTLPPGRMVLWTALLALVVGAIGAFAWRERRSLGRLLTLSPLRLEEVRVGAVALLFALPVALAVLGSNTVDVLSIRYLLITWQASSILLALLITRISRRSRWLGLFTLAVWFSAAGIRNPLQLRQIWAQEVYRTSPEATAALEEYLAERGVRGATPTTGWRMHLTSCSRSGSSSPRTTSTAICRTLRLWSGCPCRRTSSPAAACPEAE